MIVAQNLFLCGHFFVTPSVDENLLICVTAVTFLVLLSKNIERWLARNNLNLLQLLRLLHFQILKVLLMRGTK